MPYYEDGTVQMIEMAYSSEEYCMVFILPKKGVSLKKCTDYLFKKLDFEMKHVDCTIPKFTQRTKCDLKPLLQQIGINDIFSSKSRLDHMSNDKIIVSDAIHEAVVIVDENGTEASATTVVLTREIASTRPPKYINFCLNRPFIYGIKNRSGMVLFIGDYHGDIKQYRSDGPIGVRDTRWRKDNPAEFLEDQWK
jgi:serine protease inhibitor